MAAKDVEAAVHAARLYIGCESRVRISDQQRLYKRMQTRIASVAKKRNIDEADVYRQIVDKAKSMGGICPTPGKDI